MTSQLLENLVRESLIQKKADELFQAKQKPEYRNMVSQILTSCLEGYFHDLSERFGLNDRDLDEWKSEINEMPSIKALTDFSNPEKQRQGAYLEAKNEYLTVTEIKAQMEQMLGLLEEPVRDGILKPADITPFKQIGEKMCGLGDQRDKVVQYLAVVAEREGIEKALTEEAERDAIRAVFPTKQEYIAYRLDALQLAKDYLNNMTKIISKDEGAEEMVLLVNNLQRAIFSIKELSEQEIRDRALEKAEKIYGAV
ncbi:MAG: hypothetical protein AABX05_00985 [Nanoarchaeota archaeon]